MAPDTLPPVGTIVRLRDSGYYHPLAKGKHARITKIERRDPSMGEAEILNPARDPYGTLVDHQYIEIDQIELVTGNTHNREI